MLIVDDNEVNRIVASELLRTLDFEPATAESGPAAIKMLTEWSCAAILMDCEMPEMDGWETTRRIHELRKAGNLKASPDVALPIIALTAQVSEQHQADCLAAGMDAHLHKPIRRECFEQVLWKFLGERKDVAPPLDLSSVVSRCGGNEPAAHEVVRLFAGQAVTELDKLRSALETHDESSARDVAHLMKGMAGNVSADAVSRASGVIEQAIGSSTDSEGLSDHLRSLEQSIDQTLQWIETNLEDQL